MTGYAVIRHAVLGARLALVAFAAALAAACTGAMGEPGVSDSTFVRTMAKLNAIDRDSVLDSAGRANAKQQLLQEEGLTSEALIEAAGRLADDPKRARDVFLAIDRRTDSMTTQRIP